ncbi:MAG: HPF/RaiA family ribosome-associated protein [Phycisphaerae bacterium]|nr:HPF/RaiA family ribosome-associated protein [Phycisphaerae bacterium]MDW8262244.1 HPF/RaiA family ribosome-associated protein [Phycisphaerales bacterium]
MIRATISGRTSESLTRRIQTRLNYALGQFGGWIQGVQVRLWDANGPRRGSNDQHCRMTIHLRGPMHVTIEEAGDDPYQVVSRAAERAKQVVGRRVSRKRQQRPDRRHLPLFSLPKLI